MLYKVLKNNQSCHGGSFDWTEYLDGKVTPKLRVRVCSTGWHLTTDYIQWLLRGCEVYEAEGYGYSEQEVEGEDKHAFEQVKLLRKVEPLPQWWLDAQAYANEVLHTKWMDRHGDVLENWKVVNYGPLEKLEIPVDSIIAINKQLNGTGRMNAFWSLLQECYDSVPEKILRRVSTTIRFRLALIVLESGASPFRQELDARWEVWRRGYGIMVYGPEIHVV